VDFMDWFRSVAISFAFLSIPNIALWMVVIRGKTRKPNKDGMYLDYDKRARMGYLWLSNTVRPPHVQQLATKELAPGVLADYAVDTGLLVGLEVFDHPERKD
jgi:hypothetical protein